MSPTTTTAPPPCYREVYPDWRGRRPWPLFMLENLLEIRKECGLPTNSRRPDEDVNVYLAHLLAGWLDRPLGRNGFNDTAPRLQAPPTWSRRVAAAWWRAGGDHRLLSLGLFDRGSLHRRRAVPWGWTGDGARERDRADAVSCYRNAATLLAGRDDAVAAVMTSLADGFDDYLHILHTLASRRLGLGAHLSETALSHLLQYSPG